MKGDAVYKILDFLEDSSMAAADFFIAFLAAGYGASIGEMEYQQAIRGRTRSKYQIDRAKKRNLQKYIYTLKSQGFIIEKSNGQLAVSSAGRKKLGLLEGNRALDEKLYKKQPSDKVTIISYDIPIAFNRERDKVRGLLKLLGFQMIHKSVWVGKVKLPKQFIIALEKLGILPYVEILEVSKNGTLRSI
jgi:hypothetical protein